MLEKLPTTIDFSQDYLTTYWAGKFGVSPGRLAQAVQVVGNEESKVKKYLADGHRIAIRDADGVGRQVVRITLQEDGFGVLVPYHPSKTGWIFEIPLDYSKTQFTVPLSEGKHYTVSDVAKLSFHMSGFVQFSTGGGKRIVSGYNPQLHLIKGAGVRAPQPVRVTTGPLFGLTLQGIEDFEACGTKPVEMFEKEDLWYRAGFTTENDTAFNLEVFMFPTDQLAKAKAVGDKRMLRRPLPYRSRIAFQFDLRVIELPGLPFFLGAILSRFRADPGMKSGYKISGPGCGGPGEAKKCIGAVYPCPDGVKALNPTSLDYQPPEAPPAAGGGVAGGGGGVERSTQ
jgi:hypothetical protein